MNRRKFLSSLVGGIAASAAVRTFPFRVFSFPSEIHMPQTTLSATVIIPPWKKYAPLFSIGDLINVDNEVVVVTSVDLAGRFPHLTVKRGLPPVQGVIHQAATGTVLWK